MAKLENLLNEADIQQVMKIFNTLTKKKEEFKPNNPDLIKMYVCGVTVYGNLHMGHIRTYIAYDMIRNYFIHFKNKKVLFVQNITDVGHIMGDADEGEDKIENKANIEKKHPMEIVDMYIQNMWQGLDALKCDRPNIAPRATGHIVEIIDAVTELIKKGYAYEINGDVYFDVSKFKEYGALSGNKIKELEAGARIEVNNRKRHPFDFALWKKAEQGHIMQWSSPWGKGYPGWHIECSVMSQKYLGLPFDIHGGARELAFPHHENEIAQTEALTGNKMVNYWVHTGLLMISGQKMAKSIGNFINVKEALKKHKANIIRFFILSNSYSAPIDLKPDSLESSKKALDRINNYIAKLQQEAKNEHYNDQLGERLNILKSKFEEAMDDDFNTPNAISYLFDFINYTNKALASNEASPKNAREIIAYLKKINKLFKAFKFASIRRITTAPEIERLIRERTEARKKGNWNKADNLRKELYSSGIELIDNKDGSTTIIKR
ncbi:MAG: cysteine--tRNA ligase [Nanoarchaeota archaeon]|nr:cysteine--tRNA ligase [Nanoarchaeota archaeon]